MNDYGDNCLQYFNRDKIDRQKDEINKLRKQVEELKKQLKIICKQNNISYIDCKPINWKKHHVGD